MIGYVPEYEVDGANVKVDPDRDAKARPLSVIVTVSLSASEVAGSV